MNTGDRVSTPDGLDGEVVRVHSAGEYWEEAAAVVELEDGSRLTYTVDQLSSGSSAPAPEATKAKPKT